MIDYQKRKKVAKKSPKQIKTAPKKFDPTIVMSGGKEAVDMVWTTETVNVAIDNIKNGRKTYTPFYEKNPRRRGADVVFEMSQHEMDEYLRCMMDLHYFAETYCQLKNDGEVMNIKLRDYQDAQLRMFLEEPSRRHIMLWSRQASKTTSSVLYILWEMTFQNNKLTAILGNKLDTSKEVLTKMKEVYELLPFFLQAGIVGWNEKTVAFDNKCVMLARPCTKDALNGLSVYILYIDEFAFCFDGDKKQQEEFLSQAQPTLAAVKNSILIITSTPNGKDLFYDLYNRAEKGLTSFCPSKVYWWQIPNRDEAWARKQISEIGLEKFKIQFELSFDATMDKLLNPATMRRLGKVSVDFIDVRNKFENDFFENYINTDGKNSIRICPKLVDDSINMKENFYVTTSDLAEGLGGDSDFTTNHVMKLGHKMVNNKPHIYFKQEMVFESNIYSLDFFSKYMCELHSTILNQENVRYLFEANKYGDFHRLQILNIGDDEFELELYPETFFKFRRDADSNRMSIGLLTNRAIKKLAVKGFKKAMESGLFDIRDERTIKQVSNFQKDDKGNYQAEVGHDDLVTPFINMAWLISMNPMALQELCEDYLEANGLGGSKVRYLTDLTDNNSKYMMNMMSSED